MLCWLSEESRRIPQFSRVVCAHRRRAARSCWSAC